VFEMYFSEASDTDAYPAVLIGPNHSTKR